MDTRQFDSLARRLSTATQRRAMLGVLAGGALGSVGLAPAEAKRKKKKKKKVKVCLNGQTLTVLNKKKGDYFAQGAFEGTCGPAEPPPDPEPEPEPSCFDGVQNGDETGVDCGGSCARCENNQTCGQRDDCASANCVSGVCQQCTSSPQCGSDGSGTCTCNNNICTSRSGIERLNQACDSCPVGTAACQPAINGRPGVFCRPRCGVRFPT
ncbi:MAG: hypothetical protein QM692_21930 [Thermomicrobiales bacterium]